MQPVQPGQTNKNIMFRFARTFLIFTRNSKSTEKAFSSQKLCLQNRALRSSMRSPNACNNIRYLRSESASY